MSEQINKDRLNELLGIQEGQSIEDYLSDDTSMDQTQSVIEQTQRLIEETRDKVNRGEAQFNQSVQVLDDAQRQLTNPSDACGSASVRIDNLVNVENAFKSIEDLVDTTKQMIANVYGIISSCDVLDSETVNAAASLIGETRQLIGEYTSLYKQRVKFFDNWKMEQLKQQHRLELIERKHELDMEKYEKQHPAIPASATDVTNEGEVPNGMQAYGTEDILNMLSKLDDEEVS